MTNYTYGLKVKKKSNGKETFVEIVPPIPTETIRGGIVASARTDEQTEVVIDKETGRAYVGVTENILTEENIVDTLIELDMFAAVQDFNGAILSDENGNILSM